MEYSGVNEDRSPHVGLQGLLADTTDGWLCVLTALSWNYTFKVKGLLRLLYPEASILGL